MIAIGIVFIGAALVFAITAAGHHRRMRAADTRAICLDQREKRDDDLSIAALIGILGLLALVTGVLS